MPEGDAPISPPQPATPVATARTALPSETILVVDDNAANRDALARRLERRGYTVLVAGDGLAALDALARQSVDLVLLDVMMPGITGLRSSSASAATAPRPTSRSSWPPPATRART
jgi:PleD family two-component response regulator